jgi:hypothetical protein
VVTCGIQPTLVRWHEEGVVQQSAWDRIAQFEVRLQKLTPAQAELLIRRRVGVFLDTFNWLEPVNRARQDDPLFPLGRAWADRHLHVRAEVRPRDAISMAREGWQREQAELGRLTGVEWLASWPHNGRPAEDREGDALTPEQLLARIHEAVEAEIQAIRTRLHAEPGEAPPDGDRLASLLHDLIDWGKELEGTRPLVQLQRLPSPRPGATPTYHLQLRQQAEVGESVTGVLVLTARSATSAAGFLRRLADNPEPLDRLVVVTDQRVGMPLGPKGREYLSRLDQRDVPELERLELTFAEVAALEALHGVVGRARSGDLEIELRPGQCRGVTAQEVRASPAWQRLFLAQPLLRVLVGCRPEPAAPPALKGSGYRP